MDYAHQEVEDLDANFGIPLRCFARRFAIVELQRLMTSIHEYRDLAAVAWKELEHAAIEYANEQYKSKGSSYRKGKHDLADLLDALGMTEPKGANVYYRQSWLTALEGVRHLVQRTNAIQADANKALEERRMLAVAMHEAIIQRDRLAIELGEARIEIARLAANTGDR